MRWGGEYSGGRLVGQLQKWWNNSANEYLKKKSDLDVEQARRMVYDRNV